MPIRLFCTKCDDYHDQMSQCPHHTSRATDIKISHGPMDHMLGKKIRIIAREDLSPDIAGRTGIVRKWMEGRKCYQVVVSGLSKPIEVFANDMEEVI